MKSPDQARLQLLVVLVFLLAVACVISFGCAGGGLVPSKPGETSPLLDGEAITLHGKLHDIALSSECASSPHDEQGKPPKSFLRGITLSFARAVCHPGEKAVQIASQPVGSASVDFLAHYGLNPATHQERLATTYSLLVGSAARESSWRWCVGKDPGASNTTAETCEAGLYQTSWNSRAASPALTDLFRKFQASKQGCFAVEYRGATTCSEANLKNWGTGEGVAFQLLTKECPGFASEYHAVMVRVRRTHYGPINAKKSLVKPECTAMFRKIRAAVEADQRVCSTL